MIQRMMKDRYMLNNLIKLKMKKQKKIECHPIGGDLKEGLEEGFYYCIIITEEYGDNEEDNEWNEWFVYPNGKFSAETHFMSTSEPSEHIYYEGTFDRSKYNDYIEQMKNFKGDWKKELNYELTSFYPPKENFLF